MAQEPQVGLLAGAVDFRTGIVCNLPIQWPYRCMLRGAGGHGTAHEMSRHCFLARHWSHRNPVKFVQLEGLRAQTDRRRLHLRWKTRAFVTVKFSAGLRRGGGLFFSADPLIFLGVTSAEPKRNGVTLVRAISMSHKSKVFI